jgi:hypothetical protein
MRSWLVIAVMLVSSGVTAPAIAGGRGPVCREPSVVDEMSREIRDQDYYTYVNPELVTETPTADPGVVRCQVCVQFAPYDATRPGDGRIRQCLAHGFEIRILHGGFVVHDLN